MRTKLFPEFQNRGDRKNEDLCYDETNGKILTTGAVFSFVDLLSLSGQVRW